MSTEHAVNEINSSAYATQEVVDWYAALDLIFKPEAAILKKLTPIISNQKLLDIGVGGGRTTKFLLEISRDYTGIDYSGHLAGQARAKFPEAKILLADVRDMRVFENQSFDFALFSLNGIDSMNHEDRMKALSEIHRVLKPGAFFSFSSHNRDYKYFDRFPWQEGKFDLGHLKSCLYTFIHLPRHHHMKKHEMRTEGYAIINDTAHGFLMLVYYISIAEQIKQLSEAGFTDVEAYNMEGNTVKRDDNSPWIYYLARRAG